MRTDKGFVAVCDDGWAEPLVDGLAKYRIADAVEFEIDELMGVLAQGDEDPAPPAVIRYRDGFDLRINYGGAADTIRFTRAPEQVLTAADAERQRMRAGIPAFGSELTERTIPLEAGMMDWLSNTKGCYVGQEVIERMWSRDRVARRLASFVSDGEQQLTTPLQFDSDGIKATITSTFVDRGRTVALGYVNTDKPVEVQDSGITWQVSPLGPE